MSDELNDRLSRRFEGSGESTPDDEGESTTADADPTPDHDSEPEPESDPDADANAEADADPEPAYDPETEPAFPYKQREMQNSVYVRKETWKQYLSLKKMVDAQATAKGYEKIEGREIDDAILRAVSDLDAEDVADLVVDAREQRATDD